MDILTKAFSALWQVLAVGLLVESTGTWHLALLVFAGLFAIDVVCWAMLNPKGTLFDEDAK